MNKCLSATVKEHGLVTWQAWHPFDAWRHRYDVVLTEESSDDGDDKKCLFLYGTFKTAADKKCWDLTEVNWEDPTHIESRWWSGSVHVQPLKMPEGKLCFIEQPPPPPGPPPTEFSK